MRANPLPSLPRANPPTVADATTALLPMNARVAALLKPIRSISQVGSHGFEGVTEVWAPRTIVADDVPDLRQQLTRISEALTPADARRLLARIHTLLSHYRSADMPPQVEAALAEDWLDDLGEFPEWAVDDACRQWRRHPVKYRYRPLPGDIRTLCRDAVGKLPILAERLQKLLAMPLSVPAPHSLHGVKTKVRDDQDVDSSRGTAVTMLSGKGR